MAATTTRYHFPYPSPSDNNNVPADMQSLANAVDSTIGTFADAKNDGVQEGVIGGGDGKLSLLSATSLRVTAGSAWVDGDGNNGLNGRYRVTWPQTDITGIPLPSSGYRFDQVYVQIPATGHGTGTIVYSQGSTTTAGPDVKDNRNGAVDVTGAIRLADWLATPTTLGDTRLDRRLRANGFRHRVFRNTAISAASTNASAPTSLGAFAFDFRLDANGTSMFEIGLSGRANFTGGYWLGLYDNGSLVKEFDLAPQQENVMRVILQPSAGSHLYQWKHWLNNTSTDSGGMDFYTSGPGYAWCIEHIGTISNNGTS